MESYMEMKNRQQQEVNEFPLGFAFGQAQFEEMLKKFGLGVKTGHKKLIDLGAGCYVQKKDYDRWQEMLHRHAKEHREAIAGDETGDGYIYQMFLYELRNHEYGYTGDASDTLASLRLSNKTVESNPALKHGFEKARTKVMNEVWYEE